MRTEWAKLWEEVLSTALEVVGRTPEAPLLVIDELPYLLQHSPEIPGLLRLLYDRSQSGKASGRRIILCGSAMSVMNELLSGTKPLRGRAVLDLRLPAFDYRTARMHWQVADPGTALLVDACLGGAPGYRPLAPGGSPQTAAEFDDWVQRTLLDPGRALYSRVEAEFLLREDPRITHRTLYYDLLSAVARGASTPARIGGLLERQRSAVVAPLEVLESTGSATVITGLRPDRPHRRRQGHDPAARPAGRRTPRTHPVSAGGPRPPHWGCRSGPVFTSRLPPRRAAGRCPTRRPVADRSRSPVRGRTGARRPVMVLVPYRVSTRAPDPSRCQARHGRSCG